jgi:sugar phosphate isomerase/epimerase
MFLGYNTNGLAHHDLFDAVELLAEIGYRGVAITIDHNALPPSRRGILPRREQVEPSGATAGLSSSAGRLRRRLEQLGMRCVIETGARFLLDPRVKHEPTLLSEARRRRIDFYKYAIDCAAELGSECVSLWSGVLREPISRQQAMDRLVEGLQEVLDYAAARKVPIGFEPEPGMFVDSLATFQDMLAQIDRGTGPFFGGKTPSAEKPQAENMDLSPSTLRLTLDVGHLQCQGEMPIPEMIRRWAPRLVNVHLDDARTGKHEHLMFGEGEIDFAPILRTLAEVGYTGGVYVELSRHSHEGPEAARKAFQFINNLQSCPNRSFSFPFPPCVKKTWP